MRHLSTSILLLGSIISTSFAYVPRAKITAAPVAPRDGSVDFGTEVITAELSGSTTTFTHTQLASATANGAGDETWSIASPLASAIYSLYHDKAVCSGAPGQKRDYNGEEPDLQKRDYDGEARDLQKRVDPPVYAPDQLRPGPCFNARMAWLFANMAGNEALEGAIALVQNGVPDFERAVDDNNDFYVEHVQVFLLQAYDVPDLAWVPDDVLRYAVDLLVRLNFIVELYSQIVIQQWVWSHVVLKQASDPGSTCQSDENAPICDDEQCLGGKTTGFKCKLNNAWKDCKCLNEYPVDPSYAATNDWWTNYTQILDDYFPTPEVADTPVCYGLSYPKFTSQDTAAKAVSQFCGTSQYLSGSKNQTKSEIYKNPAFSTPPDNDIEIGLYYPPDQSSDTVTISSDDCNRYLLDIVNGCDAPSPQNPGNIKHGGALFMPNGVTAYINPQGSNLVTICNSASNPPHWDSQKFLTDSAKDFCSRVQSVSSQLQYTYTETDGKLPIIDKAEFSVTFDPNAKPTINDCNHILIDIIINGCDSTPTFYNWKYGGSYTTLDSVWEVAPLANRKPPDLLTYGDNGDSAFINTYGTTGINNLPLDAGMLQQCLNDMKDQGFTDHYNCGNLRFFLDGQSWNSASDCHSGCVNDLSKAINNGANNAICRRQVGGTVAKCQEGFINSN